VGRAAAILALACALPLSLTAASVGAGPAYDHDRKELESILDDLIAWLPGEWDNFPQIYHARTVRMPAEGEHEPWYRTFARIDAPQIGEYVFYGQINLGGRDGPLLGRSQLLYTAEIDEQRQVVLVRGQSPANPEQFLNLQDHPQLWGRVRMMDPDNIRCDFIWRRDGAQIVGVLDGPIEERRKYGPGTCSYISPQSGKEFFADAEWALSPELLWLYDINTLGGQQFIGRKDRTHVKLYRASAYKCEVTDADSTRSVAAYDRGFVAPLSAGASSASQQPLQWMLLRARFAAADGFGLDEQLRLMLLPSGSMQPVAQTEAAPLAERIAIDAAGVRVSCAREAHFGPMPGG